MRIVLGPRGTSIGGPRQPIWLVTSRSGKVSVRREAVRRCRLAVRRVVEIELAGCELEEAVLARISGEHAVPGLEGIERLELVVHRMLLHLVEDLLPLGRRRAAVGERRRFLLEPGGVDTRRERDLLELARLDARGADRIGQGEGEQRLPVQHADDPFGEGEADHQRRDDQERIRKRRRAAFSRRRWPCGRPYSRRDCARKESSPYRRA